MLTHCREYWGKVEVRETLPQLETFAEAIYVPYTEDRAWGLFSPDGSPVAAAVDTHGPDATATDRSPTAQDLSTDRIDTGPYLYGGVLNPHYGHFLINSLSRLWPLVTRERPAGRLLFHGAAQPEDWFRLPFVSEIFGALGLTPDDITILPRPTRVCRIAVPHTSFREQQFIHPVFVELCHRIGEALLRERTPRSGLPPVYLTKAGLSAGVGRVVNEEPLETRMRAAGVEIVRPETLSLHEQVALFAERPAVLGTAGSAFHTSVFTPPRARLLVLSTIPGPNSNFALIDAANGNLAEYLYEPGTEVAGQNEGPFITTFRLPDPEAVADDLLGILARLRPEAIAHAPLPAAPDAKVAPVPPRRQENAMSSLYQYFLDNRDRPIHKNMHYFVAYERHFAPLRGRPLTMLEIGTGGGGSSQMWKRYFGPLATIVTIDINPERVALADEQVKVRIGNQADTGFLAALVDEFGAPDIVLDDGSHIADDVKATFRFLYPRTAWNGIYLVEDLHTSYWAEYGGGFRKPGTFIELCKDLIDELNAGAVREELPPTQFTQGTISMHFYNSIVVFERGRYVDTRSVITGSAQTY